MEKSRPNYNRIYSDILKMKYPHKWEDCKTLLGKKELSVLDVIELNRKIFGSGSKYDEEINQKHRSYNKSTIFAILDYQRINKLNNSQLARHFKLSRNTVTKWKKFFCI